MVDVLEFVFGSPWRWLGTFGLLLAASGLTNFVRITINRR